MFGTFDILHLVHSRSVSIPLQVVWRIDSPWSRPMEPQDLGHGCWDQEPNHLIWAMVNGTWN